VLHRIALADGKEAWTAKTDGPLHARPLFRPEGILVATTRGTLQYLDPADGKEKNRQSLGSGIEGGCAVLGDLLYVDGDKGVLIAYDLKAGRVAWQVADLGTLVGEPSVAAGILVVASSGNGGPIVVMDP
jgi:outer membrane protein assembly factor BamB